MELNTDMAVFQLSDLARMIFPVVPAAFWCSYLVLALSFLGLAVLFQHCPVPAYIFISKNRPA